MLLDSGADVNARSEDGRTALMLASSDAHLGAVKLLVEQGADVNAKSKDGQTALMRATSRGNEQVGNYLKQHGAK
jgi:ankyrin repeat protein